jgi:hypothetical protein
MQRLNTKGGRVNGELSPRGVESGPVRGVESNRIQVIGVLTALVAGVVATRVSYRTAAPHL